ncbi:acyl-CoA dehydrogenase, partial [bacterium]|nr:acyl-CoA dehydrogenase [bacterium]
KTAGISSFLVPANTPGFRIGKQEKKLGLRASTLAELVFENCFIPQDQLLGKRGEGFKVALSQLDAGRIAIGAAGVSAAAQGIEIAWKLIPRDGSADGVRAIFAEHYAKLNGARAMMAQLSESRDKGEFLGPLAASFKLTASDLAIQVCHDAVHYLGYEGCRTGSGVERLLRDSKALQIVEGTNQIQRLVLSRALDGMVNEDAVGSTRI